MNNPFKRSVTLGCALALALMAGGAQAAVIWGSDASDSLTGSRSCDDGVCSPGLVVIPDEGFWADDFSISWNITSLGGGLWNYSYTLSSSVRDISHWLLEVTDGATAENFTFGALDTEGPQTWTAQQGNPQLPNEIYGVKFEDGGELVIYDFISDLSPVWGNFYAIDGNVPMGGGPIAAWNVGLAADFRNDETLTTTDFIVRPNSPNGNGNGNGNGIAEPGPLALLSLGLLALGAVTRRRMLG